MWVLPYFTLRPCTKQQQPCNRWEKIPRHQKHCLFGQALKNLQFVHEIRACCPDYWTSTRFDGKKSVNPLDTNNCLVYYIHILNEAFKIENKRTKVKKMRHKDPELMKLIQEYVEQFQLKKQRSPSIGEIAAGLCKSKSLIHNYLTEMSEKNMISYSAGSIVTDKTRKIRNDNTSVPILGSVSCGVPLLEEENIEEYVTLPESLFGKGEFFILRANGESMIEAGIAPGDLVVVRKQETAEEGQIVVALVNNNETTLKRFYLDDERRCVVLHPENRTMKDILVSECKIQGVAVNVIKALE